jgi:hypothetical protein
MQDLKVEFDYRQLPMEDQIALGEAIQPRFIRALAIIQQVIMMGVASEPSVGVKPSELQRKAERLRALSGDGATLVQMPADAPAILDQRAEANRLFREFTRLTRELGVIFKTYSRKYKAIMREREIQARELARDAADVEKLRELNRARHRGSGRARKRK